MREGSWIVGLDRVSNPFLDFVSSRPRPPLFQDFRAPQSGFPIGPRPTKVEPEMIFRVKGQSINDVTNLWP